MLSYPRLYEILIYLHAQHRPLPSIDVAYHFSISERTLRSDIHNINSTLTSHGASIVQKRSLGYFISIQDDVKFTAFIDDMKQEDGLLKELDTAEKRIHYILQHLLFAQDYQSQEAFAHLVYVSRNTITNYLKTIKKMLQEYSLELHTKANLGIKVIGKEEAKRAFIIETLIPHDVPSYIVGFRKEEEKIFASIDLHELEHMVLTYTKEHNFSFSDFNLKNLILHIALLISRVQMGCAIEEEEKNMQEDVLFSEIAPLLQLIEKAFSITITKGEVYYLYSHFISNVSNVPERMKNTAQIKYIVQQLLHLIYANYYFDLRKDELLIADLNHHFQSILHTKYYNLNKRNPLLHTIKTNYPLAFEITLTSVKQVFEREPYQLTEDEIGYVSLHIGAAIERCFNAQIRKKNILIVCGSGYATSRMLEAKLNNILKDKIVICGCYSYNEYLEHDIQGIDFIISTIPIETKAIPVVIVNFSLYTKDIENITKMLAQQKDASNCIDKFFDEALFMKCHSYASKDALLHDLCNVLNKQNYVRETFVTSVLKREQLASTNMDEVLAIPHPMELCAYKTKVAVAILDEPLAWNNKRSCVRIILLLAIKKDEHQDIEHLYDAFIQIMNNVTMRNLLLKCKDYHEFMHILHIYRHTA